MVDIQAVMRIVCILLGGGIVMVVQLTIFPVLASRQLADGMVGSLQDIAALLTDTTAMPSTVEAKASAAAGGLESGEGGVAADT